MKNSYIFIGVLVLGLLGLGVSVFRSQSVSNILQENFTSVEAVGGFQKVSSVEVRDGDKPTLVMLGALFCPFCGAERWPLKIAAERFGSWENLGEDKSSDGSVVKEPWLSLPTYNFYQARYKSDYISFLHRDYADRNGKTLQKIDGLVADLVNKYNPRASIPFVIIGGQYARSGASFSPSLLAGKSFVEVEKSVSSRDETDLVKAIYAEADLITAYLCNLTGGVPTSACQIESVRSYLSQIQ